MRSSFYVMLSMSLRLICCLTTRMAAKDILNGYTRRNNQDIFNKNKVLEVNLKKILTGIYTCDIDVGTPKQKIQVAFDTGSSDSWVWLLDADVCQSERKKCENSQSYFFNSSASLSLHSLNESFDVVYHAAEVKGEWQMDTLALGNAKLSQMRFGSVTSAKLLSPGFGVIGLGLKPFESTYTSEYGLDYRFPNTQKPSEHKYVYNNFPVTLQKSQVIEKNCFSVYYPSNDNSSNVFLFGGVDTTKYDNLTTLPIIEKISGKVISFDRPTMLAVELSQMYLKNEKMQSGLQKLNYPALLDTLTYTTIAPEEFVNTLASSLKGNYSSQDNGTGIVFKCANNHDYDLLFDFQGSTLQMHLLDFSEREGDTCFLPVEKNKDRFIVLGSQFLSKFYTFFDLERLEISVGQLIGSSKESDITAVKSQERPFNSASAKNFSKIFNFRPNN